MDKKHEIIVDAQAFGEGSEQQILKAIIQQIEEPYTRLKIDDDIYKANAIGTADTGFACEENMKYLHEEGIDAYIPDNQFRSRDPKFVCQRKDGKRHQDTNKKDEPTVIPASEFQFYPVLKAYICPAG